MTKKTIIETLRKYESATIAFNGLVNADQVRLARKTIVAHWQTNVDAFNNRFPATPVTLVVSDTQVCAGGKFQFLPRLPLSGKMGVRSSDYVIGGVCM